MRELLTDVEISLLAKEVEFEMTQWLINRLMDYRYRDSLKIIKQISILFQETIKKTLE